MKRHTIFGRGALRALAAIGLAGALLLSGCGGAAQQGQADSGSGKTERQEANELTVGIAQDLDESLDPHYSVAAGTREIMFNVFEGLLKPTPDGQLAPAIAAEAPTVSEDGLTYTFKVRKGVKFHNGQEVTADDVVWSIERCWKPADADAPLVAGLAAVQEVEKVDDETVKITLSAPNNEFLACMTLAILPMDYADQATQPVGTGPYKFVSRVAQDNAVFERFEDYWGEPASIGKVTFKIMEKAESLVLGLQSGALDVVMHLSSTQTSQLSQDEFNIEQDTMKLVQALYLNNAEAPLNDVRVRQALCYAVDKQGVIDLAFDGYGSPLGSSMYPSFSKYFDESLVDYYPHDVAKAKELLKEAGYPDGFDLEITVPSNYQPHVDAATVIAEQLKEAGINATLKKVEWATWLDEVYSGRKFQATVIGLESKDMTARALLERFQSEKSGNFINYSNSEYDELYAQAIASGDDAEQTAIYKQMLQNLTENAANVYIQDLADLVAVRKGLTGLTFYPLYVLDISKLAWEQ